MKTAAQIVKKYQKQLNKIDYKTIKNDFSPTIYLFQKWGYKVGKFWYGFDLEGVPFVWAQIIDDFLVEAEKECPNFVIQQYKLKFGGLRAYMADITPKVNKATSELEEILYNKDLIY